jgi:phage terminase small subunit
MIAKRQRFVTEYLVDLNATQAAIRAGYSPKTARQCGARMLTFADVRQEIETAKAEQAKRTQIDADWVIRKLVKNFRRAMQESPVFDKEGNATGKFQYRGAVANKALELIGRHFGAFPEKVEHTGKDGGPIRIRAAQDLTDDDLAIVVLAHHAAGGRNGASGQAQIETQSY